jgi:Icc-related predicted phosphoesterase
VGIRLALISDTHNQHRDIQIPECDVLVHAGDYSYTGDYQSIWELNQWFGKLKSSGNVGQVITCAGNHDFGFEKNPSLFRSIMTNCVYLQDEPFEHLGYRWYGSPRTPEFCNWAFNERRGDQIKRWWDRIPDDTQILVTHGPPFGILDQVWDQPYNPITGPEHLGCEELRKRVDELKQLKLHVFGHIHGSSGEFLDPVTQKKFINAAICSEEYKPIQPVRLVEI